jgi:peptidyl-prolyl cis-trans isomerase A (cyclophilin A)
MDAAMKAFLLVGMLALTACAKNDEPVSTGSASSGGGSVATAATTAAVATPKPSGPLASVVHPDLLDPTKFTAKAPDLFQAQFTSTKGDFVVEVHRDWAPNAADRFFNLVKSGFFDDTRFFRVVDGFMVQFGINGDPAVASKWMNSNIQDDPVKQSNKRGFVTFAQTNAPNSRSTQVFVNFGDNGRLDATRVAPFGQITKGMDVVDSLYKGYGEGAPGGAGPNQGLIQSQGNVYLDKSFPKLDAITHAVIVAK